MKGYGIEVRLLEWKTKSDGHKMVYKELKAHYLGSFSNQTAEKTYKRLSSILAHTNPVIGTKMLIAGRGKRRRNR